MAPLRVPGAPSAETDPLVGRVVAAMESANQHLTRCVQALDLSTGERQPKPAFPFSFAKCEICIYQDRLGTNVVPKS